MHTTFNPPAAGWNSVCHKYANHSNEMSGYQNKERHKYLSETNWRIHGEAATQKVSVLGLIPLITLSRHSWTDVHRARPCGSYPRKTRRDYPRTSMNFCAPKIVASAEKRGYFTLRNVGLTRTVSTFRSDSESRCERGCSVLLHYTGCFARRGAVVTSFIKASRGASEGAERVMFTPALTKPDMKSTGAPSVLRDSSKSDTTFFFSFLFFSPT